MKNEKILLPEQTLAKAINFQVEKRLCVAAAILTGVASFFVAADLLAALFNNVSDRDWLSFLRHATFGVINAFLIYGGLVYLLTRWAYYTRRELHRAASADTLIRLFRADAPTLSILIPSYKEEDKVVFQTMMSAALQQYPKKRIVLLLDDPHHPKNEADRQSLALARNQPARIVETLRPMAKLTARARTDFYSRLASAHYATQTEFTFLFNAYQNVIEWFDTFARVYPVTDHTDRAFVDNVLKKQSSILTQRLVELQARKDESHSEALDTLLSLEYARLVALFSADASVFERKAFENLSHESNKAMNLNSYIGLMGKTLKRTRRAGVLFLEETDSESGDLTIPAADFLITLDADSLIVPDYALRLIDVMLQSGNERLGVIQTPYSAFPGATKALERVAAATTDIQYIIHQGFSHFNGTFWVGANALIRRTALNEIAVVEQERGYSVTRFIQDRTVIEDTESSVDLIERGWFLHNYPERMAFSATPPDFGSLVIQRRRWANGGLIILPKLLRYLGRGPLTRAKMAEAFVRIHYLASIAAVNIGLVLALAVPLATDLSTAWLPFTALGYFLMYGRDLKLIGYQYRDLFGVYAVNLLLIPINLAGVFKSMQQAWTKEKIPFGRTPKIGNRTATQPIFIIALFVLMLDWVFAGTISIADHYFLHGMFALINASILFYAITRYIGLRESWDDVFARTVAPRQRLGKTLYRRWIRVNRSTINVLGKTPIVRLVVKPKLALRVTNNATSKEAA